MTDSAAADWRHVLRHHRHDLLNGLQLVSGYLQLGRPERAGQSLERVIAWLRTISWIQLCSDRDACYAWLQASHTAAHVLLRNMPNALTLNQIRDNALAAAWCWLEETASLRGLMEIGIDVMGQDEIEMTTCTLCVEKTADMDAWWSTRPELSGIEWKAVG